MRRRVRARRVGVLLSHRLYIFCRLISDAHADHDADGTDKHDKLARGSEIVTPGTSPVPYTRLSADAC